MILFQYIYENRYKIICHLRDIKNYIFCYYNIYFSVDVFIDDNNDYFDCCHIIMKNVILHIKNNKIKFVHCRLKNQASKFIKYILLI